MNRARDERQQLSEPDTPPPGEAGSSLDDWQEESNRQAQRLAIAPAQEPSLFAEFRRKLAGGEVISRALEKLAEAIRFSGRITITFHQGKLTKTLLEESYFQGKRGM